MGRWKAWLAHVRGDPVEQDPQRLRTLAASIGRCEETLQSCTSAALRDRARAMADEIREGGSARSISVEWFALVREVANRELGVRAFDTQMVAGLALTEGAVCELATGEGKTLVVVLAASLRALAGKGVHVLTANDYLARRDAAWMAPVYENLGLTVSAVHERMNPADRRKVYAADVTYGAATEIGFDFLRDRLAKLPEHTTQRELASAIVDEVDSILIDEARIPLVIAGRSATARVHSSTPTPAEAATLVRTLDEGSDYQCDTERRNASLSESGARKVERELGCESLYTDSNRDTLAMLNLSLHAHALLERDVDYIVRDGEIELIDAFKGRVADRRRWPHGLQAALEAKEHLRNTEEGRPLGSITLQALLRLYPYWSGVTATAQSAAIDFFELYRKGVIAIPQNRPCKRIDLPDRVYTHAEARDAAVAREVARVHTTGRPILVGTASVSESEALAERLADLGVDCQLLNARNDEAEATVIADAGAVAAVTISTNMAGRGTDIRLGGADERGREAVVALGGLYVIGTNRHDCKRIDDQLRGRSGRQGDPGASRFYVSLEDPLIERYGVLDLMPVEYQRSRVNEAIDDLRVARQIAHAQRIVEAQHADIRKALENYTRGTESMRQGLQSWRQEVLTGLSSGGLDQLAPDMAQQLRETFGESGFVAVERDITLASIDAEWADHLERVNEIREGIHFFHGLKGFGGLGVTNFGKGGPLTHFREREIESFESLQDQIDEAMLSAAKSALRRGSGTGDEPLPSAPTDSAGATWAYVVGDDPYAVAPGRMTRGLRETIRDQLHRLTSRMA
jgi:preprotein translocase subunit SecA